MQKFYCRVAPSLGALEGTHQEVWGTEEYDPKKHKNEPTVFMGLYDIRDYIALIKHKGDKYILWCGSDLRNLLNNYLFNDGKLKWLSDVFQKTPRFLLKFLRHSCSNWVENEDERYKLETLGIISTIVPSFMGNIDDFPVSYRHSERPNIYVSGHPGREEEYGWEFLREIANEVPECNFHLYGSGIQMALPKYSNFLIHGQIPKEQMNKEIKEMQCGLRLNTSDGFSEITAKSVLMGQYPITALKYPVIANYSAPDELVGLLKALGEKKAPNLAGAEYYRTILNKYPWNLKK